VSKAINPSKVISTAAYLLFYRRRSETPLGGQLLQEITEASTRADSEDNQDDSRTGSPSGEGRRLVDSSRNGSTSALAGVGAVHQAGDGGLRAGLQVRSVEVDSSEGDDNELPPYEQKQHDQVKFSLTDRPAWSFDNISGPPVSDDDGLFDDDDNDSNKAVGGGDMSDLEEAVDGRANFHSITDDTAAASDDDEDLPVVELRVNEDDRLI
jgi:ubiquitin carboxyl-terminal hydrolase 4/11